MGEEDAVLGQGVPGFQGEEGPAFPHPDDHLSQGGLFQVGFGHPGVFQEGPEPVPPDPKPRVARSEAEGLQDGLLERWRSPSTRTSSTGTATRLAT